MQATISEMLFMPDGLPDAPYLISIQPAPFALDAAPSWVVAYPLIEISEREG
jgi:hypothetical protein